MIFSKMASAVVDHVTELKAVSIIQQYINDSQLLSSTKDYVTIRTVLIGVGCCLLVYHVTKNRQNSPPGPMPIPLVGNTERTYV